VSGFGLLTIWAGQIVRLIVNGFIFGIGRLGQIITSVKGLV